MKLKLPTSYCILTENWTVVTLAASKETHWADRTADLSACNLAEATGKSLAALLVLKLVVLWAADLEASSVDVMAGL